MSQLRQTSTFPGIAPAWPLVVGTVYSAESLDAAGQLTGDNGGPDLVELRVDHFAENPGDLERLTRAAPRPFIVTVRHPEEGGAGKLDAGRRRELFARFHRHARFIDIEVRSLETLKEIVQSSLTNGCGVIASFHDFEGMPESPRLRTEAARAIDHGAQVLKIAAQVESAAELAIFLEFLSSEHRLPLALMGMGTFGRVSRLVLAAAGSVLNYGFLGETSQVNGQWPAALLRERIDELLCDQEPVEARRVIESLLAGTRTD